MIEDVEIHWGHSRSKMAAAFRTIAVLAFVSFYVYHKVLGSGWLSRRDRNYRRKLDAQCLVQPQVAPECSAMIGPIK